MQPVPQPDPVPSSSQQVPASRPSEAETSLEAFNQIEHSLLAQYEALFAVLAEYRSITTFSDEAHITGTLSPENLDGDIRECTDTIVKMGGKLQEIITTLGKDEQQLLELIDQMKDRFVSIPNGNINIESYKQSIKSDILTNLNHMCD